MRPLLGPSDNQREGQWISISDMMAGLMVIFLFVAISFMVDAIQKTKDAQKLVEDVKEVSDSHRDLQDELHEALNKEFETDLERWNASLDRETLYIRFNPEEFFERGSSRLPEKFLRIMDEFFPRYIAVVSNPKFRGHIEEIRIEGHTSSEWEGAATPRIAYIHNMELSQDRTRSVLEYVISLKKDAIQKDQAWILSKLTANGLSSSKLLDSDGKLIAQSGNKEDPSKSRRVEFRVRINTEKKLKEIGGAVEKFKKYLDKWRNR